MSTWFPLERSKKRSEVGIVSLHGPRSQDQLTSEVLAFLVCSISVGLLICSCFGCRKLNMIRSEISSQSMSQNRSGHSFQWQLFEVGKGKNTCFWSDRWLHAQRLDQMLPHLFAALAPRAWKRSIFDAITGARWITDIKGALTLDVLRIPLNQLTRHCSLEPPVLAHGREYGRVGHPVSASYFYGLLHVTDVGQPFAWLEKSSLPSGLSSL